MTSVRCDPPAAMATPPKVTAEAVDVDVMPENDAAAQAAPSGTEWHRVAPSGTEWHRVAPSETVALSGIEWHQSHEWPTHNAQRGTLAFHGGPHKLHMLACIP